MGKKVAKGSFFIFISLLTTSLLKVLLVAFLARILGPAKYGQYSAVLAFCLIIGVVFRSGLTESIMKSISSEREKIYSLSRFGFLSQLIWSFLIFLTVLLGANFWAVHIFKDPSFVSYIRIASLHFVPMALFLIGCSVLTAQREFIKRASLVFLWYLLQIIIVFIFVLHWKSINSIFYAMFFAALLALLPFKRLLKNIEKKKTEIDKKRIITLSSTLIVSVVSLRAIFQVDKIFVKNILQDNNIVGIYALGSNVSTVLQLFTMALVLTLFPSVSASFAKADLNLTRKYLWGGTRYLMLIGIPVSIGSILVGKDFILLIFGSKYIAAFSPFAILVLASAFFSFFLLYHQLLVSINRSLEIVFISIMVLFLALVLNPVLIDKYGFMGAAWATFISSIVGAIICGYYLFRLLRLRYPWKALLRISTGVAVCYYAATLVVNFSHIARYTSYAALSIIFVVFLIVSRELTRDDWEVAKGMFSKN